MTALRAHRTFQKTPVIYKVEAADIVTGRGDQPARALNRLAEALRVLRGSVTGGDR